MDSFLKGSCQRCGGHLEFPAESVGASTQCPHCGASTRLKPSDTALTDIWAEEELERAAEQQRGDEDPMRKMVIKTAVIGMALILVVVAVAYGANYFSHRAAQRARAGASSVPPVPGPLNQPRPGEELSVLSFGLQQQPGSSLRYVTGIATNRSTQQLFSVRVEFDLLDAKGQRVGKAQDQLGALEGRKAWNFKALVIQKEVQKANLAGIKGER